VVECPHTPANTLIHRRIDKAVALLEMHQDPAKAQFRYSHRLSSVYNPRAGINCHPTQIERKTGHVVMWTSKFKASAIRMTGTGGGKYARTRIGKNGLREFIPSVNVHLQFHTHQEIILCVRNVMRILAQSLRWPRHAYRGVSTV
jgi:hypothetical protein